MNNTLEKRQKICMALFQAGLDRRKETVDLLVEQLQDISKQLPVPTFEIPTGDPKVGDLIYLPTRMSIDHGYDDVCGGVGIVMKINSGISAGKPTPFVTTHEQPGRSYNWNWLREEQEDLKVDYGDCWASPDPDLG